MQVIVDTTDRYKGIKRKKQKQKIKTKASELWLFRKESFIDKLIKQNNPKCDPNSQSRSQDSSVDIYL